MNILVCGIGSIGRRHIRILKELGVKNFIAYRSEKNGKKISDDSIKEIFDLNEIADHKIDGALITNPTSLHVKTATTLATAGIPMLIEKPLGKDLDGIDELQKIVTEKNVQVLMGYNFIYHPAIMEMKKLIAEEKIGRIVAARSQFGTYMPGWHKEEDYKKSYAALPELGGGVVLTSIHEQNYLTDFFGKVTDVMAMEVGGSEIGIDSEEAVEILMKHESGVVSNVHLNFFQKPYFRNCQLIGNDGTMFWDFMKPEITILKKDNAETIKLGKDAMELLDVSYKEQLKHFLDVISKNVEPRITLQDGINDMKVALKILTDIKRNLN
ncbi:MAG: Gfo/Idh/MocA family oxidoreductase [bacterium]|nr:Gfo/Idh/MocA family oxidoreductase [bacterium]